jgi:hypothetical protein
MSGQQTSVINVSGTGSKCHQALCSPCLSAEMHFVFILHFLMSKCHTPARFFSEHGAMVDSSHSCMFHTRTGWLKYTATRLAWNYSCTWMMQGYNDNVSSALQYRQRYGWFLCFMSFWNYRYPLSLIFTRNVKIEKNYTRYVQIMK